ncbi:MAG: hypothetical protein NVS2B16_02710 [Chloroflexota bacterium]
MLTLLTPIQHVSFVSVDVETTGLDPRRDQIVEIGAVKVTGGETVGEFSTLVSIGRAIPLAARRVHGIDDRMLVGQPSISEAMHSLLQFVGDSPLVEHSHRVFDIAFLESALGKPIDSPCLNTCTLSRKLFPFHRSHSLSECCRRFHIDNDGAHRALADARATSRLLTCLLDVCVSRYPRLKDLVDIASVQR